MRKWQNSIGIAALDVDGEFIKFKKEFLNLPEVTLWDLFLARQITNNLRSCGNFTLSEFRYFSLEFFPGEDVAAAAAL